MTPHRKFWCFKDTAGTQMHPWVYQSEMGSHVVSVPLFFRREHPERDAVLEGLASVASDVFLWDGALVCGQ